MVLKSETPCSRPSRSECRARARELLGTGTRGIGHGRLRVRIGPAAVVPPAPAIAPATWSLLSAAAVVDAAAYARAGGVRGGHPHGRSDVGQDERQQARRAREQYRATIAERSRLASELHDTLEQGLAGIQLQLGAVSPDARQSPQTARRALGTASDMLRYSLSEARRSVMDLRHGALETRDLEGALSDVAHQMTTGTSLNATVARPIGAARPLRAGRASPAADRPGSADQQHQAFRRDARRRRAAVSHDDGVHLVVTDDGRGFATTRLERSAVTSACAGFANGSNKIGGALTLENRRTAARSSRCMSRRHAPGSSRVASGTSAMR